MARSQNAVQLQTQMVDGMKAFKEFLLQPKFVRYLPFYGPRVFQEDSFCGNGAVHIEVPYVISVSLSYIIPENFSCYQPDFQNI